MSKKLLNPKLGGGGDRQIAWPLCLNISEDGSMTNDFFSGNIEIKPGNSL